MIPREPASGLGVGITRTSVLYSGGRKGHIATGKYGGRTEIAKRGTRLVLLRSRGDVQARVRRR